MDDEFAWIEKCLIEAMPGHIAWLDSFKEICYPTFKHYGLDFAQSVMFYKLHCLSNDIWDSQKPPSDNWEENENA